MELKPLENKVWLASPTMHGPEIEYIDIITTDTRDSAHRTYREAHHSYRCSREHDCLTHIGQPLPIGYGLSRLLHVSYLLSACSILRKGRLRHETRYESHQNNS